MVREFAKRLMGALVRMHPKPHKDMKLGDRRLRRGQAYVSKRAHAGKAHSR